MKITSVLVPGIGKHVKFTDRAAMKVGHPLRKFVQPFGMQALPAATLPIDWTKNNTLLFPIDGNDTYGDCMYAASCHADNTFTGNNGPESVFSLQTIVSDYLALSGGDNGLNESQMTGEWQKGLANVPEANIFEALDVDPNNAQLCQAAIQLFGGVLFMLSVPTAWINGFATGHIWTSRSGVVANPANGHGCFTGDTKVSLLNGKELSFLELVDGAAGNCFYVYSCDENGNVVPGKAHSVRKTRKNAPIVKITLDNNEVIRCTSDHLFLMRDGTYKEANKLTKNDSIMPLYRKYNKTGYELFYNPRTKGWQTTHRVVAFGVGGKTEGMVTHHYDFNKRNNSPDNLKVMTSEDHMRLHEETSAILKNYAQSDKGRTKSKEMMNALWDNQEWRECITKKLKCMAADAGNKASALGKCGFQMADKDSLREMVIQNNKKRRGIKKTPRAIANAAAARKAKYDNDPEFRDKMRLAAAAASAAAKNKRLINQNNHKIISVEDDGTEDVYDLTVDNYHNFALSSGVFVHNCWWNGCDVNGNYKLQTWGTYGWITPAGVALCDPSAFVVFSKRWFNAQGIAPNGMTYEQLAALWVQAGGHTPPPFTPTPPGPIPPPTPTPPPPSPALFHFKLMSPVRANQMLMMRVPVAMPQGAYAVTAVSSSAESCVDAFVDDK